MRQILANHEPQLPPAARGRRLPLTNAPGPVPPEASATSSKPVAMDDVSIKVRESGPYRVTGTVTLTDADGNIYTVEGENFALCRCGGSETKPFCDGTHKSNGFSATERATPPAESR